MTDVATHSAKRRENPVNCARIVVHNVQMPPPIPVFSWPNCIRPSRQHGPRWWIKIPFGWMSILATALTPRSIQEFFNCDHLLSLSEPLPQSFRFLNPSLTRCFRNQGLCRSQACQQPLPEEEEKNSCLVAAFLCRCSLWVSLGWMTPGLK
jgi:hypothetical protein